MAENLPKRQIAGDAKWLSTIARLNRRGGHGDISNEVVIGDDWKEAYAKILWALSQLQRGCQNPVLGLRAECWAPEIGETFSGLNPLIPSNETNELLKPNHTYYVRTRRSTAVTLWLPDATDSDGEVIEVKDVDGSADTKNITVKTTKGQTIDGASTLTISASYGSVQIRSNGQQWYTVARKNANDGLTGNEVTQTTASTADNRLYRTDRPSSDNRVAQITGITCDDSNNLSGVGTLASGAHTVTQATPGSTVLKLVTTATNDDPTLDIKQGRATTTGAVSATVFTFDLSAAGYYHVLVHAVYSRDDQARGGSVIYEQVYNSDGGGSVTLIGSHRTSHVTDTTVAFAMNISGSNVTADFTGVAAQTFAYHAIWASASKVAT